ncbi:MAG TPA: lysophospholipid acyltransferase family protein [Pyrinomonadaceae bacterium]
MSESSTSVVERRRRNTAQQEEVILPKWALDVIRPMGRTLSRLLWRIRYEGIENIPSSGGLIVAANHQTYIDPFWIGFPINRAQRFLAWDEAFDWPVVGKLMRLMGAWPLQIEKSDPTAIRRTLQWLRDGGVVTIFPEGGRALPTGELSRFKPGAVRMALEANVPILPVTIRGAHRVWPKGYRLPRFANVEIIYHPLHYATPQEGEDARLCARRESERLAEIIGKELKK